jgi:hypothetical protein
MITLSLMQAALIVQIRYQISLSSVYSNDLLRWLHFFAMGDHIVILL